MALSRFHELAEAADARRPLEPGELHEVGALLSEVLQAAATLAGHVTAETARFAKREDLRDTTGAPDPRARLAEVRTRMDLLAAFLRKADQHARRSHAAIGHIVTTTAPAAD
ncbi:hypothetical protein [Spongiactinospora sp. TRM90649]|uniref:hypothetical protein n=1 Tax=Spongiactinospora sp. TRM90649 TaxID=3031114 RepID=UPI0023F78C56|nr:hypothetical protein [Spongiactinospora sp. TRM90649]MDF5751421.1 hypothetical protein [Spongiactinospora sp. TRM90649]